MKKLVIAIICLLIFCADGLAHPPTTMNIRYNPDSKQITVIMNHRTSKGGKDKRRKHYIEEVTLAVNDEVVETKTFKFQQNTSIVRVSLTLPEYEKEDVFTVEAKDSKGAKATKTFSATDLPRYAIIKD
jgi:desulfoferrodoxin (superoxide reductase-like protein)